MQAVNAAANTDTVGPPTPWKILPEIIETKRVPVMLYADRQYVETEAIQQLIKLAESPMPVSRYTVRVPCKRMHDDPGGSYGLGYHP